MRIFNVGIIMIFLRNIFFSAYRTAFSALMGLEEDEVPATVLNSVSTEPGQKADTVTPVPLASLATDCVSRSTKALLA